MKKVIILLIVMFIVFINVKTRAFNIKHIDLKLSDNEVAVVFLRLNNSNSLLINNSNSSNLFILNYNNDVKLKESLKIFDIKPDIFYLNGNVDKKIDNIHIIKKGSDFKFRINNYSLCICNNKLYNNDCDFVYLTNLNQEFEINENISAIFYDDSIKMKWLKQVQESWIDSHIISTDSFTILKFSEESYNILAIPSTNINN